MIDQVPDPNGNTTAINYTDLDAATGTGTRSSPTPTATKPNTSTRTACFRPGPWDTAAPHPQPGPTAATATHSSKTLSPTRTPAPPATATTRTETSSREQTRSGTPGRRHITDFDERTSRRGRLAADGVRESLAAFCCYCWRLDGVAAGGRAASACDLCGVRH